MGCFIFREEAEDIIRQRSRGVVILKHYQVVALLEYLEDNYDYAPDDKKYAGPLSEIIHELKKAVR